MGERKASARDDLLRISANREKPSPAEYIYNWWIEYAPFETLFYEATSWKKPVTDNFPEHFLFLTDSEIAELREWASKKGKDVMNIDPATCREFWGEFQKALR